MTQVIEPISSVSNYIVLIQRKIEKITYNHYNYIVKTSNYILAPISLVTISFQAQVHDKY